MQVNVDIDGTKAVVRMGDKLTVQTAPDLEAAIAALSDDICNIDIDLENVD